ncbi:MAG: gluconeogenesis factor YvcK family protein [Litorilinea sp.]
MTKPDLPPPQAGRTPDPASGPQPAGQNIRRNDPRRNGPKIVAIGGGTGLPQLLRGLRRYTDHITAVVTVADDGGSSGRLRRGMGMLPPGDFRNNIAALSEAEDLMTRLFQYRFPSSNPQNGDEEANPLAGHSFGNLFIATMAAVTGSFEAAIAESSRVLAVRGRVLPSTLEQIVLCAEITRKSAQGTDERLVVEGESRIPEAGGRIERVFLRPDTARAYPGTIQAILQADLIVAGPGSFYTSVLPNLLVPSIRAAICATPTPHIYICNVATQRGETDGYTVSDHMRELRHHAGDAFTAVLANDNYNMSQPPPFLAGKWVTLPPAAESLDYQLYTGDLVDAAHPWRHDPEKLAAKLMEVYQVYK